MNNYQQAALEAIIERSLSPEEMAELDPYVASRTDGKIAEILSRDRKKLVPTEIGYGTIVAALRGVGAGGGAFLDTISAIAAADRDVFYTIKSIDRGVFRIDMMESRMGLQAIAGVVPSLAPHVAKLLTLGYADDPVPASKVSEALNSVGV